MPCPASKQMIFLRFISPQRWRQVSSVVIVQKKQSMRRLNIVPGKETWIKTEDN
jgi:hypothetical protein